MKPIASTAALPLVAGDYWDYATREFGPVVCGDFVHRHWSVPYRQDRRIRLHFFHRQATDTWPVWLQRDVTDGVLHWSAWQCAEPSKVMWVTMQCLLRRALGHRLDNRAVVKLWVQCEIVEDRA